MDRFFDKGDLAAWTKHKHGECLKAYGSLKAWNARLGLSAGR